MSYDARMLSGALAGLPAAFATLVPELAVHPLSGEARADCGNCVMMPAVSGDPPDSEWVFEPGSRCCTYNPALTNFAAGTLVQMGGEGAALLMRRLEDPLGVSAWGIRPSAAWIERYNKTAKQRFGRDMGLRCPYFLGGALSCGIWPVRPAICRTWYCKHEHGLHSAVMWTQTQRVLSYVESLLADFCAAPEHHDSGPPAEGSPAAAWAQWFAACAAVLSRAPASEIAALGDAVLAGARADLALLLRRPTPLVPDVLVPAVTKALPDPRGIRIVGYSHYDSVIAPPWIFVFLAKLDGSRPWRLAQAETRTETGHDIPDELIAELCRIGALEAKDARDPRILHRHHLPVVP